MAGPVSCRIVDMSDGRFAVVAVLASGKIFCRAGLMTMVAAEESLQDLCALMAACGAPDFRVGSPLDTWCAGLDAGHRPASNRVHHADLSQPRISPLMSVGNLIGRPKSEPP